MCYIRNGGDNRRPGDDGGGEQQSRVAAAAAEDGWSQLEHREGKWTARRRTVRVSEERSRDAKREAEGKVTLEE